jgi:hypothetical protein
MAGTSPAMTKWEAILSVSRQRQIHFSNSGHANTSPKNFEGCEAPRDATSLSAVSRPFACANNASVKRAGTRIVSQRFAYRFFVGRGPRFSWVRTLHCTSPSAVLPAGERNLAGRCPAPSRSAAANRARRRRPLPAFTTPHERALERKRRAELTRAAKRGDLFFRDFQKPLRSNEIFKYRKSDIPALTITGAEKETGRGCGPFDVNSASCPAFKSAIANTWMAGTSPAMTNKSYPAAVCGFTDCRFCESLFKALI